MFGSSERPNVLYGLACVAVQHVCSQKWTSGHFCTVAVPPAKNEHIGRISMAVIGDDDIVGIRACGLWKDACRRSVSKAPPEAGRGIDWRRNRIQSGWPERPSYLPLACLSSQNLPSAHQAALTASGGKNSPSGGQTIYSSSRSNAVGVSP